MQNLQHDRNNITCLFFKFIREFRCIYLKSDCECADFQFHFVTCNHKLAILTSDELVLDFCCRYMYLVSKSLTSFEVGEYRNNREPKH